MKKIFRFLLFLMIITAGLAVASYYYINEELNENIPATDTIIITFPNNTNLDKCVGILNQSGIFEPGWLYELIVKGYSKLYTQHVFAGSYKFKPGMTNKDILNSIFSGENLFIVRITYPEGITLNKFAEITATKFRIKKDRFLRLVNSPEALRKRGIKARTAEGYLMPSTYEFFFNPGLEKIIDKLFNTQDKLWKEKYAQRAKRMGWSRHKILTLASIIEAETPVIDERARISGVYHNRLNKGMLLQADPTVQYAVGGKQRLLYSDLEINNPYNTYKYTGLPPGPINSPSLSSIEAALNPEKHDFLFFVAKGDGTNRHNFARNHNEHLTFVAQYRRNLRRD
ncbi:endolytic transglycosylase MltG [Bacteroidota bacterium]